MIKLPHKSQREVQTHRSRDLSFIDTRSNIDISTAYHYQTSNTFGVHCRVNEFGKLIAIWYDMIAAPCNANNSHGDKVCVNFIRCLPVSPFSVWPSLWSERRSDGQTGGRQCGLGYQSRLALLLFSRLFRDWIYTDLIYSRAATTVARIRADIRPTATLHYAVICVMCQLTM